MSALSKKLRSAAHGIVMFWCPGCDGAHAIRVDSHGGSGPGWGWNGDAEAPTFTPSILVNAGRANPQADVCHSFVREGRIQFLSDCTHALAGRTVDLPDFDS